MCRPNEFVHPACSLQKKTTKKSFFFNLLNRIFFNRNKAEKKTLPDQ
jgi:hypothetical protein